MRSTDPLSTHSNSNTDTIDIILLGDFRVGKTSLAKKITKLDTTKSLYPTIAIQFHSLSLTTKSHEFHVKLWDTSGQNKYRKVALEYLQKTQAAIVVFDVTKYSTYHIAKEWINEIREIQECQQIQNQHIPIVLFGNKTDLCLSKFKDIENLREVKEEDIQEYVQKSGILYGQGCALADNEFTKTIKNLLQNFFLPHDIILQGQQESKKCCC